MKRNLFFAILMLLALGLMSSCQRKYESVKGDNLHARIYTLPNGLKVYLTRNTDKPEIQTFVAVRAGGMYDPLESTGLAHYMEHIMFKGTSRYGTTDYAAEKVYLDRIDSLYEQYGHTTDAKKRKSIYHEIDSISYLSSKIAIASEFDKLMEGIGAKGVNAFTSSDMTCYHEVIPAMELDRWAAIESGRFQDLVIRGFHTELETVYEEFNLYSTMDNIKCLQAVNNILFPNIPYRQHEVIGTQEHLQNPSLLNMKWFWNTYYRPNNVAICLSGDLDFDKTMAIIEKYFGAWEPNAEIPALTAYEAPELSAPKDTVVMGLEAPQLWLAWTFPAMSDDDAEIVEIMSEVLMNGKCGLMDMDVVQKQRVLDCFAACSFDSDYSTFYLYGTAKEGQNLDSVRAILIAEIEKLKAGDFSDKMLQGIIANFRKQQMQSEQYNYSRCRQFITSFIYGIPWEKMVGKQDRLARITKEEIVRVANRYFTNGYAAVYKQQGKDKSLKEIEKPHISPIEMNRGVQSAFADSILQIEVPALQPQFLDFSKDLSIGSLRGREWLYRQNKDNELFTISINIHGGTLQNPELELACDMMPYLGTKTRSAEQIKEELYLLAGEMGIYTSDDETTIYLSGLHENMPAIFNLLQDWLLNSQADGNVYKQLAADVIRNHEDRKADQQSCFIALRQYGWYGEETLRHITLTPEDMNAIVPDSLTKRIKEKVLASAQIMYYGPAGEKEIRQMLDTCVLMQGEAALEKADHLKPLEMKEPKVLVAPYDAPNIYYIAYANWGEVYDPKEEAIVRLFNQYFDGTMGSIVFQEMREARALCYTSSAYYGLPSYEGDCYDFYNFIVTQTDKMQDCVETFAQICDSMPQVAATFEQAKKAVMMKIEQQRYTRDQPLWAYTRFQRKGWDHDYNEDVYREVQKLTMEDLIAFQQAQVAHRTYGYAILGDPKKIDMKYLKSLGEVKQLSLKDIFVY